MGLLLKSQGKLDEAEVYYTEALEGFRRVLGNEHPYTLYSINDLAELYDAWGKPEEAQKYRDMLPEEDAVPEDTDE
jgi:tetratricopeptide (TPR) repeat protein